MIPAVSAKIMPGFFRMEAQKMLVKSMVWAVDWTG
jgi:hypothetical protein